MALTLTHFTPAEAEKITGVSVSTQRDWRRRKFLGSHEGHARFDIFDLGEMAVMQMLAFRGIGPAQSTQLSPFTGLGVAWEVLNNRAAYSGDHDLTLSWNSTFAPGGPRANDWEPKGEWLAKHSLKNKFGPITPANYFIWWPDGSHHFDYSLDMAFSPKNTKLNLDRLHGPAVVIDLAAVGEMILSRCSKPFVEVEYEIENGRAKAPAPARSPGETR